MDTNITWTVFVMFTEKYGTLYNQWYEAARKNFFPDTPREFVVFSDIPPSELDGKWYQIEGGQWPKVVVERYEIIEKSFPVSTTHCVYIDVDLMVNRKVDFTIINTDASYFGMDHPCGNILSSLEMARKNSRACVTYIPLGYHYKQGCLWGGKSNFFISMVRTLAEYTRLDLKDGIIPKWNDESYLNRFFIDHYNEVYSIPEICMSGETRPGCHNQMAYFIHLYQNFFPNRSIPR